MVTRMRSAAPAALLLALVLTGCTTPGAVYEAMVCGRQVVYHPDDLKPCPDGASACTVQRGSALSHVYYSSADTAVMAHENEHVCGMRHREPWAEVAGKSCTEVTNGGLTQWKRGDIMCRMDAGAPVRITDNLMRTQIVAAAGWSTMAPLYASADASMQSGAALTRSAATPAPGDPLAAAFAAWPMERERSETLRVQNQAAWAMAYGDKLKPRNTPADEARYYLPLQGPRRAAAQSIIQARDEVATAPRGGL